MPKDKEAPVYTAEQILDKRTHRGKIEYLIKWKGWTSKWNTWEPEKHILDKLLITDYNSRNQKCQKSRSLLHQSKSSLRKFSSASICTQKSESDQNYLFNSSKESKTIKDESSKFDESIRELLWQPTKSITPTNVTITEVIDSDGIAILIRELNEK